MYYVLGCPKKRTECIELWHTLLCSSYVKIYLLPDKRSKQKTKTKKDTLNPKYDELLEVSLPKVLFLKLSNCKPLLLERAPDVCVCIYIFIKFSTSDNAFRILWLVHWILVISSYTLVWPYMENDCAKRC